MASLHNMQCCAVCEINGIMINDPKKVLIDVHKSPNYCANNGASPAFLVFTSRDEPQFTYGRVFKQFIIDNKLGNVVESNAKRNIKYIHDVTHDTRVYIWEVDHIAYNKWFEENKPVTEIPKDTPPSNGNGGIFGHKINF